VRHDDLERPRHLVGEVDEAAAALLGIVGPREDRQLRQPPGGDRVADGREGPRPRCEGRSSTSRRSAANAATSSRSARLSTASRAKRSAASMIVEGRRSIASRPGSSLSCTTRRISATRPTR
jgi:hypothetical protein